MAVIDLNNTHYRQKMAGINKLAVILKSTEIKKTRNGKRT